MKTFVSARVRSYDQPSEDPWSDAMFYAENIESVTRTPRCDDPPHVTINLAECQPLQVHPDDWDDIRAAMGRAGT